MFDWSLTERKLVLFIPNYGRKRYLRSCLISLTRTRVPRSDWLVLVGNDGIEEKMDDLAEEFNLAYFTLPRPDPTVPRNGAFIRNYVIKRCRSQFIFQKDPEVALAPVDPSYDIIAHMTDIKPFEIWRNGRPINIKVPEEQISAGLPVDERLIPGYVRPETDLFATHWGYCIRTEDLRSIRGYDERFVKYGSEDGDLLRRLLRLGFTFKRDFRVFAIHVSHQIDFADLKAMLLVARQAEQDPPVRNDPQRWGEG